MKGHQKSLLKAEFFKNNFLNENIEKIKGFFFSQFFVIFPDLALFFHPIFSRVLRKFLIQKIFYLEKSITWICKNVFFGNLSEFKWMKLSTELDFFLVINRKLEFPFFISKPISFLEIFHSLRFSISVRTQLLFLFEKLFPIRIYLIISTSYEADEKKFF